MLDLITPLILTRDEEPNIGRTLAQLAWAREVVMVDSLSGDDTVKIKPGFGQALQLSFQRNIEFARMIASSHYPRRRFGQCI